MTQATAFSSVDTARLHIRRLVAADVIPFLRYRSDPDVIRFQEWEEVTPDEVRFYVDHLQQREPGEPGRPFQFAVEHKQDQVLIGDMALGVQVDNPRVAEIGYTLAPAYQHQGYGFEMVSALLDYAYAALKLHRVYARVLHDNAASINLLERLAFRREGTFVEQIWFNGAWRDQLIFGQLEREWLQRRSQNGAAP